MLFKDYLNETMKYDDSERGAIELIKKHSNVGKRGKNFVVPDPEVSGVWLVFNYNETYKKDDGWRGFIAYTNEGDFEEVDDVKKALEKYGKKHPTINDMIT